MMFGTGKETGTGTGKGKYARDSKELRTDTGKMKG